MKDWRFLRNTIIKGLFLFLVLNIAFAAINPIPSIAKISIYNHLVPGRLRFPFGESPATSYNLSLYSLDAMFRSHVIANKPKPADEFRVILLGDSSVWGTLLKPDETLSGYLNTMNLDTCPGKAIRFYNLGYPTLSLTKDIMILTDAMQYEPDLIIWLVTLESFPRKIQLNSPLVANNPNEVRPLITSNNLQLDIFDPEFQDPTFFQRTIIGQRRAIADIIRLQLLGIPWAATQIDQEYPGDYQPAQRDLEADTSYQGWQPPDLPEQELAFDVLQAGMHIAGSIPVILVNEPILISTGKNSNLRYNFFYPRWAYDQYRQFLQERGSISGWNYIDLWDLIPEAEFTNSAIHLFPSGSRMLAQRLALELNPDICH